MPSQFLNTYIDLKGNPFCKSSSFSEGDGRMLVKIGINIVMNLIFSLELISCLIRLIYKKLSVLRVFNAVYRNEKSGTVFGSYDRRFQILPAPSEENLPLKNLSI